MIALQWFGKFIKLIKLFLYVSSLKLDILYTIIYILFKSPGVISRQEKEIEELKAQMLAVMPTEFVTPVTGTVSKLRLSDGSPLDPNASVYTPKQLCSDA